MRANYLARGASVILVLASCNAWAHKASTSYLHLDVESDVLSGRWDIAVRDLDYAIGLDVNADAQITWGELRAAKPRIVNYALAALRVSDPESQCSLSAPTLAVIEHSDGNYAVLGLRGRCPHVVSRLSVDYRLLFDLDALHRGLAAVSFKTRANSATPRNGLFAPDSHVLSFTASESGAGRVFTQYLRAGLLHVWSGLDHLLFLAGIFLPAVLRREHGRWIPVQNIGIAVRDTALIVTAFTIAHACTLTLAATGAFTLPSRLVESAVALTVLFAGLNNLVPMAYRELVWLAGVFGLIHGAAIASALIDLGLPPQGRVWALLAFNLGVEAAQLSLLLLVIPPTYYFRFSPHYRRWILIPGSALVVLFGLSWFIERAFGLWLGVPLP